MTAVSNVEQSKPEQRRESSASALRSGLVYTFAQAAPKVVSFLLLPVFTRVLSPADYGQLSVALSANAVASIVFALGLEVIIFRGLYQLGHDPDARTRFLGSIWSFLLVCPLVMAVLLSAGLTPVLLNSHVLTADRLALSLLGAALFVSATTAPLAFLRAEERKRDYLILVGICTLGSTLLTVAFVVLVKGGVVGWLLALLVANALALVFALRRIPYRMPRPFDRKQVRGALALSLPVLPHYAAMWSLQLVDRLLVAGLLSTSSAGLYSLGSNLALPMLSMVIGFGQGFMPAYAKAGVKDGHGRSLAEVITSQITLVAILCVACALLGPPAVHLLTNHRYSRAAPLVPWIVLGYGFLGFYGVPMNGITLTHGRTRGVAIVSGLGAATNIVLIVVLAPRYGLEAVAIASAAGYAVLLVGVVTFAKVVGASLHYPKMRIAAIVAVCGGGYAVLASAFGYTTPVDFILRAAGVLLLAALSATALTFPRLPSLRMLRG